MFATVVDLDDFVMVPERSLVATESQLQIKPDKSVSRPGLAHYLYVAIPQDGDPLPFRFQNKSSPRCGNIC
jgi:hypothetical protein